MFPNGWPGTALLLLRLVGGILLIGNGVHALVSGAEFYIAILQALAIGGGLLMLLGLWTPVAGAFTFVAETCLTFLGTPQEQSSILLAALGAALIALGPGIRSLDALLYGRTRVDIV